MTLTRRSFIRTLGLAGAAGSISNFGKQANAASGNDAADSTMGVLVDIPNCIGCRKCEYACQESAGFAPAPIATFDDKSVFAMHRRPESSSYTVVNEIRRPNGGTPPFYVKINCLHCNDPACVSACLVGALVKRENGAVTYDASKCMGCRYCMVACPFQVPAYDYDDALTPQVRKCTFCFEQTARNGNVPACVRICPNDALTYGKRSDLLVLAHERIRAHPDKYIDHVYGEYEAGGTAWLYLSGVSFEQLGFPGMGPDSIPAITETLQHAVFKNWVPPLLLYGLLAMIMKLTGKEPERALATMESPQPERASHGSGERSMSLEILRPNRGSKNENAAHRIRQAHAGVGRR